MQENIKPCPFCGAKARVSRECELVRCTECGGNVCSARYSLEQAIAAWNTRAEKEGVEDA